MFHEVLGTNYIYIRNQFPGNEKTFNDSSLIPTKEAKWQKECHGFVNPVCPEAATPCFTLNTCFKPLNQNNIWTKYVANIVF